MSCADVYSCIVVGVFMPGAPFVRIFVLLSSPPSGERPLAAATIDFRGRRELATAAQHPYWLSSASAMVRWVLSTVAASNSTLSSIPTSQ